MDLGQKKAYVIRHRACGHVGAIGNSRENGERILADLQLATGDHGWRLKAETHTFDEMTALVEEFASGAACDTCKVELRRDVQWAGGGIAEHHGIMQDVGTEKVGAEIPDPGPGEHLWVVLSMHRVVPQDGPSTYQLDRENLLSIDGPGCFKCEIKAGAPEAKLPCAGSMT